MRQADVAKSIGISQQRYSQIEREEVTPNQSERNKLKVIFDDDKPLLKPSQIVVLLNISKSYVYKLSNDGALPSVMFSIPMEGKRAKATLRF
jgi:DNA-binding XRE family transcriptional regulator